MQPTRSASLAAEGAIGDDAEKGPVSVGDSTIVASVRPHFHALFKHLTFSDSLCLSVEGTQTQRLERSNFTYGESSLLALSRVLDVLDLPSYCCRCGDGAAAVVTPRGARCDHCGRRRGGAAIFDLGSGVGNVVVGAALLAAAGQIPLSSVEGVELLQPLHAAADAVLTRLRELFGGGGANSDTSSTDSLPAASPPLPAPLPVCAAHCADLLSFDWSGADVVYMASTIFTNEVMQAFSRKAAEKLAVGSRVVTLKVPLAHPAFVHETTLIVQMSWGEELAHIHRNTWGADLAGLD